MSGAALSVVDLTVRFRGNTALDSVSLDVAPGAVTGLVGLNGAGKSTLLNAISGFVRPCQGRVLLGGQDVTATPPEARAAAGLGRTFQGGSVFGALTVGENLRAFSLAENRRADRGRMADFVRAYGGGTDLGAAVRELPAGVRKLVGFTALLADAVRVALIDEPTSGLTESEYEPVMKAIADLGAAGAAVVLVEHNLRVVRALCPETVYMEAGRVAMHGPTDEVLGSDLVTTAYVGEARA